jgi:small subunit ribosomal protein S6
MNTSYEFVFLLHNEGFTKNLKELIASFGGTVEKEEDWGEKTLAYPIRKKGTAHFYEWAVTLPQLSLNDFKKKLSFEDDMVRYLLLKKEEDKKKKAK